MAVALVLFGFDMSGVLAPGLVAWRLRLLWALTLGCVLNVAYAFALCTELVCWTLV